MKITCRIVGLLIALSGVFCVGVPPRMCAQAETPSNLGLSMLSIGEAKPGAVELRLSTNTPAQGFYSPGDRVWVTLESPREVYLTIMHVSDSGNITILYPDKDKGENSVPATEKVTLFGEKSNAHLVVGKEIERGGTVAYLSPRQFSVALLRFFQGKQWMEIPSTADRDLRLLKEKLDIVSGDRGFNRIEVPIKGKSGKNCALTITKQGRAITQERGSGL
jgi:hypothetical protein